MYWLGKQYPVKALISFFLICAFMSSEISFALPLNAKTSTLAPELRFSKTYQPQLQALTDAGVPATARTLQELILGICQIHRGKNHLAVNGYLNEMGQADRPGRTVEFLNVRERTDLKTTAIFEIIGHEQVRFEISGKFSGPMICDDIAIKPIMLSPDTAAEKAVKPKASKHDMRKTPGGFNGFSQQMRGVVHKGIHEKGVNYGLLPFDHPAVVFARERARALLSGMVPEDIPNVYILATRGQGPNACVYSDGTILLTPELLQMVRYEEELDFILLHEWMHFYKSHQKEKKESLKGWRIVERLGLGRYHELEADMAAFSKMMELGRSGKAAIRVFEKMVRYDERRNAFLKNKKDKKAEKRGKDKVSQSKSSWDFDHGTLYDRLLNLKSAVFLTDMCNLDSNMAAAEPNIRASLAGLGRGGYVDHLIKEHSIKGGKEKKWRNRTNQILRLRDKAHLRKILAQSIPFVEQNYKSAVIDLEHAETGIETMPPNKRKDARMEIVHQKLLAEVRYHKQLLTMYRRKHNECLRAETAGMSLLSKQIYTYMIGEKLNDVQAVARSLVSEPTFINELNAAYSRQREPMNWHKAEQLYGWFIEHAAAAGSIYYGATGIFDSQKYLKAAMDYLDLIEKAGKDNGFDSWGTIDLSARITSLWINAIEMCQNTLTANNTYNAQKNNFIQACSDLESGMRVELLAPVIRIERGERGLLSGPLQSEYDNEKPVITGILRRLETIKAAVKEMKEHPERYDFDRLHALLIEASENLNELPEYICENRRQEAMNQPGHRGYTSAVRRKAIIANIVPELVVLNNQDDMSLITREVRLYSAFVSSVCDNKDDFEKYIGFYLHISGKDASGSAQQIGQDERPMANLEATATLERLNVIRNALKSPGKAASMMGFTPRVQTTDYDISDNRTWQKLAMTCLANELKTQDNRTGFFAVLDSFIMEWPVDMVDALSENDRRFILEKGINLLPLRPGTKDGRLMHDLLSLSFFMRDAVIRNHIQEYALTQLAKNDTLTSYEAMNLAFAKYKVQGLYSGLSVFKAIMEKCKTYPELDELKQHTKVLLEAFKSSRATGAMVLIDGGFEKMLDSGDKLSLLDSMLRSWKNDSALRKHMAEYWLKYKDSINRDMERDIPSLQDLRATHETGDEWLENPRPNTKLAMPAPMPVDLNFLPYDILMEKIYSLNMSGRYFLLRKLLSGAEGALSAPEYRVLLLDTFLRSFLNGQGDLAAQNVIKKVLGAVFYTISPDELYLRINQLLLDRIAVEPKEPGIDTWEVLKADNWAKQLADYILDQEGWMNKKTRTKPWFKRFRKSLYELIWRKFSWYFRGNSYESEDRDRTLEEQAFQAVPEAFYKMRVDQMGPIELVLEIARQLGAPGVRFLQLLGYTVDIPEEYRSKFMDMYDSVEGQSLLTFGETLRSRLPDYAARIIDFDQRIGGGSLYTVRTVDIKADGKEYPGMEGQEIREAVRVLNPNCLYQSRITVNIIKNALVKLAAEDPDPRFGQALMLIDLLLEWIEYEIKDKTYENDDKDFHDMWNGCKFEGFNSKIVIPRSIPTGTPAIRREEYVPGTNFRYLSTFPESERKELVALASRHYICQIMGARTMEEALMNPDQSRISLVHSDISPGNLGKTVSGDLVIYDRGMYLKFDQYDRDFIMSLVSSAPGAAQTKCFVDWALQLGSNEAVRAGLAAAGKTSDGIAEDINKNIDTTKGPEKILLELLVGVHRYGLRVPLKYILLFKNINVLNKMSIEAGFGSLIEAAGWTPVQKENKRQSKRINEKIVNSKKFDSMFKDYRSITQGSRDMLKGYPVNMVVDVSGINKDAFKNGGTALELEGNIDTLARLLLWYRGFGMNIKVMLIDNRGQDHVSIAEGLLRKALEKTIQSGDHDFIEHIFETHNHQNTITVRLLQEKTAKEMSSDGTRTYTVCLASIDDYKSVVIPNYCAASSVGLSLAALRIACENSPDTYKERVKNTSRLIRNIYKRAGIDAEDINDDVVDLMVNGSPSTRMYYALKFILPPIARVSVEKARETIERIALFLQAA